MTKETLIVPDSPSQSMDDETLAALRDSIQHWRENVEAESMTDVSVEAADCALCVKFFDLDCAGCPVADRTGERFCYGTPYVKARNNLFSWLTSAGGNRDEWRAAAQAELDFLISLLPEGEKS